MAKTTTFNDICIEKHYLSLRSQDFRPKFTKILRILLKKFCDPGVYECVINTPY